MDGWSRMGKTLALCRRRKGNGDFDVIYSDHAAGGEEKPMTAAKGMDDGPEIPGTGKYIYFKSERTGHCRSGHCAPTEANRKTDYVGKRTIGFRTFRRDGEQDGVPWFRRMTRE